MPTVSKVLNINYDIHVFTFDSYISMPTVSKVSGDTEPDLREAEVSPELVQALANQEIGAEDIGRLFYGY